MCKTKWTRRRASFYRVLRNLSLVAILCSNVWLLLLLRFCGKVRGGIHHCCKRWPGCRGAPTDHQRLDLDAEEDHWRLSVVQQDLGGLPWRVWISDRKRQLLAGTWQGLLSHAAGQPQTQSSGRRKSSYFHDHRLFLPFGQTFLKIAISRSQFSVSGLIFKFP